MKFETIIGLITIIGAFFGTFLFIDGRYALKEDVQPVLSGNTSQDEFFGHEQARSEGIKAPDGSIKCKSKHYVCGLKYDHFENFENDLTNDLTIEPICCEP